ncbi:MAG: ATP-binding cassette domain-containing protein, partial [Candidatus Limnocylindria bacterium]
YGPRMALRGLSFRLEAGRILGFLGPNGAGKTTAIRILTTTMQPSAGTFSVDGISASEPDRIRRRIGVLPENLGFPKQMTGVEYLAFFGMLYGLGAAQARERALALLADVGLQQRATSRIGTYSHGMRQRLGIARALVNEPRVVFLDEPTLGLDPRGQQELLALIKRIARERGASVVLCSHLLSEIEGICDDVVILNLGQVVASGKVAEVLGEAGRNVIQVRVAPASVAKAREVLEAAPGVKSVAMTDELSGVLSVELATPDGREASAEPMARNTLLEALIGARVPIVSFGVAGNRLQDLFLQVTDEAIS